MTLHLIDWLIVGAYVLFAILVGLWYRKKASSGMASYFVADRSLPWWLLGISMVATTFAADTPLAVTGIVANQGIWGNWFWWSLSLSHLLVVFLVARLWRRTRVITDAELIELRYDGRAAATLRAFKAFFFAVIINCITMGWVIRAVGKITHSFIRWEEWFPQAYESLLAVWPQNISISDPGEGVSIVLMAMIALFYALLGGIRSVIVTDLVQYAIAQVGAILFAFYAVNHVGGLDSLVTQLHTLYPDDASHILSFVPEGVAGAALFAFATYLTVQWWAQHNSDGGGYFAQRMLSAKDENHARKGVLLFTLLHYLLRSWPWILVGLVALVVYPLVPSAGVDPSPDYARVLGDREAAYPVLIFKLLPVGLIGVMAASLIAAFMSTIDTHVNWGSSYLVNDLYKRFMRPNATERELVSASRWASVLVLVIALAVTTRIDSVKTAWEFFTALGAGLGLPHLLRWVWWRISAWSELAGLVAAAVVTITLYIAFPDLPYTHKLLTTVSISVVSMLTVTFIAPPVSRAKLEAFHAQVDPPGFWGPFRKPGQSSTGLKRLGRALLSWAIAWLLLASSLFATGAILVGNRIVGAVVMAVCVVGWVILLTRKDRSSGQSV